MFKPVFFGENSHVAIPCYQSDDLFWLTWLENDFGEDVLKRHSMDNDDDTWTRFRIWPTGQFSGDYSEIELVFYEMRCCQTQLPYYLCCLNELKDINSVYSCVALPFNQLNIIKLCNDLLANFAGKPYVFGD